MPADEKNPVNLLHGIEWEFARCESFIGKDSKSLLIDLSHRLSCAILNELDKMIIHFHEPPTGVVFRENHFRSILTSHKVSNEHLCFLFSLFF